MVHSERRSASRVQLRARVRLIIDEKTFESKANLRDISLDGLSFSTTSEIPLNSICNLAITISGSSSTLELSAKGRVLRSDSQGVAVKFTEIDMDSYMHLRNIVLQDRDPDLSLFAG